MKRAILLRVEVEGDNALVSAMEAVGRVGSGLVLEGYSIMIMNAAVEEDE